MTGKKALKRLKQETAPATYMPDFDKDKCIEIINQDLDRLEKIDEANKNLCRINAEILGESIDIHNKNVTLKFKLEQLEKENTKLKQENQGVKDDNTRLWHVLECANNENDKLKQAIKILKDKLKLDVSLNIDDEFSLEVKINKTCNTPNIIYLKYLETEQAQLLKQVFESVGEE